MKLLNGLLALVLLLSACGAPKLSEETLQADAAMLANLQCEAKKLQDERFQLATDIRMLEDSILNATDSTLIPAYQAKLDALTGTKEDMALRTKTMADSITHVLEQLHQGTYKDTADRKLLDVALSGQYEQLCK